MDPVVQDRNARLTRPRVQLWQRHCCCPDGAQLVQEVGDATRPAPGPRASCGCSGDSSESPLNSPFLAHLPCSAWAAPPPGAEPHGRRVIVVVTAPPRTCSAHDTQVGAPAAGAASGTRGFAAGLPPASGLHAEPGTGVAVPSDQVDLNDARAGREGAREA